MKIGDIIYIGDIPYIVFSYDTYGLCLMCFNTGMKTTCWFAPDNTMPVEPKPDNVEWLEIKRQEFMYKKKRVGGWR